MTPEPRIWSTYDFDRDCPGNPARIPGCRCINHRPDLYPSTVTITGATLCTAPALPALPPLPVGTYVVPR